MDNNIFVKIIKVFIILVMVASAVLTGFIIKYSGDMGTDSALADKILNPTFALAFFLFGFGILVTLVFAVMGMISDPKQAARSLIGVVLLGCVYFLAYFLASGNIDAKVYVDFNISSAESKLIGSLIYLVYFLGGLSIAAIIFSGVNKLLLKR